MRIDAGVARQLMMVARKRARRWLPWTVAGVAIVLVVANVTVTILGLHQLDPFALFTSVLLAVDLLVVGALLASRRPDNVVGILLLVAGLGTTIAFGGGTYAELDHVLGGGRLPFVVAVAWVTSWMFVPTIGLLAIILPLVFPDGRLPGPRWRLVVYSSVVCLGLIAAQSAFAPAELLGGDVRIANPLQLPQPFATWLDTSANAANAIAPILLLAATAGLIIRFRRSTGVERAQLKWFLLVASVVAIAFAPAVLNVGPISDIGWVIGLIGLAFLPIAIGMAVVRYRLYEIDRIVSRTLAYGLLMGILAVVYVGGVVIVGAVLAPFANGGPVAVAASTMTVFGLFQPLRTRLKGAMDRRFNRSRDGAARIVEAFAVRSRDEVDIDVLVASFADTARATIEPSSVGVWLVHRIEAGTRGR